MEDGGGGGARNTCGKPGEEVYFFVMVIHILRIWHQICGVTSRCVLVVFTQYGCPINFFNYFFLPIFYINTKLNSLGASLWYLSPSLW